MLQNYLKIALRNFRRHQLHTWLNVAGLTFGLTCFLLLGLYLFDELTFDSQHSQADRIYRVIEHQKTKNEELNIAGSNYQLAEESKKKIPEIVNTTRIARFGRANLMNPDKPGYKVHESLTVADNSLMEIFDFQVLEGDTKTALKEPNAIVITEELAQRYFHTNHVLGKTMHMDFQEEPLKITAVLKNHPRNSSFDFPLVISEATFLTDTSFQQDVSQDWDSNEFMTFVLLGKNADPTLVATKLTQLVDDNTEPEEGTSVSYSLQGLKDMHLYSEGIVDGARNPNVAALSSGSLFYLRIFGVVGLFVLFIACINYMNLTTAKASNRSKEIGVRKTVGAFRQHLVAQFLTESVLLTVVSFLAAVVLTNILLPYFNQFLQKELTLNLRSDPRIWLFSMATLLLAGLLAGSYPSLMLSRFSPVMLLKNLKLKNTGDLSLRKILVVFQFVVSVVMIFATIVLYQQVKYLNDKDLGFKKDLLIVVDINSGKIRQGAETVQAEFAKIPGVREVSVTSRVPGEWKTIPTVKVRKEGSNEEHQIAYFLGVDEAFFKTFEIELLQGQAFSSLGDTSSVLLNETAAKMLGIGEASGQWVEIPERAFETSYFPLRGEVTFRAKVTGIVKDFHFQTLREKIAPMVIGYQSNPVHSIDYFTSRVGPSDISGTLQKMEAALLAIDPNHPLEYHFLDEQLALFYAEDRQRQTMLIWAAIAAIFIACMGLFGLATYAAEQRIKEIGVRKVLGATMVGIVSLLSKDFLKLVLIALVIASPLAYFFMEKWLQDFAYRIEIQWWVFVLAGVLAIGVAFLTVSFQSVKAALVNPVKSLRSE
ncbi:MAG TPA: ABC transporter permease [Saprospiraceae bacterium]|nr:ABC transporter permease [Saprospiraceae bacterium]HMQ83158.1 ABC transporter permease [Saprospiraceae bacterium]